MVSTKLQQKQRRAQRTRAKITGTAERPRLNVFRSNNHIYAQLIDDSSGKVLVSANSVSLAKKEKLSDANNKTEVAKVVGKELAEAALQAKIKRSLFDRGPYRYHGRVRALAESAREAGLKF